MAEEVVLYQGPDRHWPAFVLAPFDPAARAKRTHAWRHELTDAELAEVDPMYRRVVELKRTAGQEVSGLHLIALFVKRCMQPLQHRSSLMLHFAGEDDPTRVLHEAFSSIELETRVQRLTKVSQRDLSHQLLECPVRPFSLDFLLAEVSGVDYPCLYR